MYEFGSGPGHVGRSVANGSPPLQRFVGAMLPLRKVAEMAATTRYLLQRSTTNMMNI